jgi:hypothetical protein
MPTRALSSRLYSSWRELGAIRVISPLRPEVVLDNLGRSNHDVTIPEELKEFGVTDLSAEVKDSQFEIHWIAVSGVAGQRCRGFVRAADNGSCITARFSASWIDFLLIAYLPLVAIVGALVGRSQWYLLAFVGITAALMFVSKMNRGAQPMRARLIQLISIVAKAPHS